MRGRFSSSPFVSIQTPCAGRAWRGFDSCFIIETIHSVWSVRTVSNTWQQSQHFHASFAAVLILFALFVVQNIRISRKWRGLVFDTKRSVLCVFVPHHNAKLLRLCQVVVFVLHLAQDIELLLIWQLLDQILGGNKWQRHLKMTKFIIQIYYPQKTIFTVTWTLQICYLFFNDSLILFNCLCIIKIISNYCDWLNREREIEREW